MRSQKPLTRSILTCDFWSLTSLMPGNRQLAQAQPAVVWGHPFVAIHTEAISMQLRAGLGCEQSIQKNTAAQDNRIQAGRAAQPAAGLSDHVHHRRVEAPGDEPGRNLASCIFGNCVDQWARVDD